MSIRVTEILSLEAGRFLASATSRRAGAAALLLTAGLTVGACGAGTESSAGSGLSAGGVRLKNPGPATTEPTRIQIDPQGRQESKDYVTGQERNDRINGAVQAAGAKIVQAAAAGQLGPMDFYNFSSEVWSQGSGNEGWGVLENSPRPGEPATRMSVYLYHNNDGSYDLGKGVQGLRVASEGKPTIFFESPQFGDLYGSGSGDSWAVTLLPGLTSGQIAGAETSELTDESNPVSALRFNDDSALRLLGTQIPNSSTVS